MRSEAEIREAAELFSRHARELSVTSNAMDVLELAGATALADLLRWVGGNDSPQMDELLADLRQRYKEPSDAK